jgi:Xaa-Pro aminopeptidase
VAPDTLLMIDELRLRAEAVGERYDRAMMLEARRRTRDAINAIASRIVTGMYEEDALQLTKRMLREAGLGRGWHGVHVRFGTNTLKTFGAPSDPGVVLGANDIFFIDIGPVWRDWEGDGGDTFVVGDDPDMRRIARDVRAVFDSVQQHWRDEGLTGEALYHTAVVEAESRGWQLNLDMSGHRLADFPHAALHKDALASTPFTPSPGLWMLEIQIRHPDRPFSAFFEDLLLDPADA